MFIELKKILKICLCIFLLYLCVFYWSPFIEFVKLVISAASPLILGICVAFIVNILMSCYEKWFFPSKKSGFVAKIRRPLCMIGAFATAILVLTLAIWLVVPQLSDCIQIIISFLMQIPQYMKEFIVKAQDWDFIPRSVLDYLAGIDWESRITALVSWLSSGVGDVVNTLAKTIMSIVSGVITTIIGLIFSIYLLLDKDNLKRQFKKLFENYLPEKTCGKLFYVFRIFKDSFKKFIVGQLTEAVILGVLCILGMLIFGLPYATMIGTLVGFTALIPIAGAYIGAATGALMILTVSPTKALGFLIFILILQQLEGNIIYPRVVGSSIGLPGIWVLAAVTIGGGCFGILGMLIGVPLTSAVYRIIREDLQRRNKIEAVVTEQKNDAAECRDEDVPDAEDSEKVEKN